MLKSAKLADDARSMFVNERQDIRHDDVRIALSLGPYGASLFPAQEFDGFYPPPYGPKTFSDAGENFNAFDDDDAAENSVDALARFHLERLLVFARNPETWKSVDLIAFETVPLAREVKAIRRAVSMLQEEMRNADREFLMKPWWITLVFPDGRYPETEYPTGQNLSVRQVADAALANEHIHYPVPSAIGLNCVQTEFFSDTLTGLQQAMDVILEDGTRRPWLVIYPNGGDVYDPISRTWKVKGSTGTKGSAWADRLWEVVGQVRSQGTWEGVLVGGCCRTGPDEISALSRLSIG
jgi:homocysteine S-methyltransferase